MQHLAQTGAPEDRDSYCKLTGIASHAFEVLHACLTRRGHCAILALLTHFCPPTLPLIPSLVPPHQPQDPHIHLKNLKPSPPVNPLVNHCIECGFCESNCPSRDLTLTPRQRIAVWKEIFRLENLELLTDEQTHR